MERLAKHPEVGGYGEMLLRGQEGWSNWPRGAADRPSITTYLKDRGVREDEMRRHLKLYPYLDYLFEPRRGLRAIGFKLMYGHVARYPGVLPYLRLRNIRVVHLFRTNLLDLFLSREAVLQRQFMHARSPAERETIKVDVDTARLPTELQRIEREQRLASQLLRMLRLDVLELSYESLLSDDAGLYAALDFIGIEEAAGVDLSPIMLKLAPMSHREGVANFEDVAATLTRTRFGHLLRA